MLWTALATLALGRVVEKDEPFTAQEYWTLWQHFKSFDEHTGYATSAEHNDRFEVFKSNMDMAREFNKKGEYSFQLGVTQFADLTQEEFGAWLTKSNGVKPKVEAGTCGSYDKSKHPAAPASVDWTTKGAVTPVKNQGSCGSCWAFSTTGGIEGQNQLKTGTLSSFSEQELVDCSSAEGNQGCNGGLMDDGFAFVMKDGLCFESAYPYEGTDGTCRESSCTEKVKLSGCTDIPAGDTDSLKSASANVGPISIAVDANFWWQMYSGGIFDKSCNPDKLDHGVLLVGYGDGYWKVKNSWASSWGESGYIRLKGDANTCGLANSASYPIIA